MSFDYRYTYLVLYECISEFYDNMNHTSMRRKCLDDVMLRLNVVILRD